MEIKAQTKEVTFDSCVTPSDCGKVCVKKGTAVL